MKKDKPPEPPKRKARRRRAVKQPQPLEDPPPARRITKAWAVKATERAFLAGFDSGSHVIDAMAKTWANQDVEKLVVYLVGVLQGLARQVGRVEAALSHSGRVNGAVIEALRNERISEYYRYVCNQVHPNREPIEPKSFEELLIILGIEVPKEDVEPKAANVIPLPVLFKSP